MEVRERIRINGRPLTREKFAKYFFDCWDNLLNNADVSLLYLQSNVVYEMIHILNVLQTTRNKRCAIYLHLWHN